MKNTLFNLRNALLTGMVLGLGIAAQSQMVIINLGINQPAALLVDAGSAAINLCEGDTVTLGGSPTASGGTAPYTYTWSPGTGLSATNVPNPVASPTTTTAYSLMVVDSNNCSSNGGVTVTVNTTPSAQFSHTANGLQVSFTDQSTGTVTGWMWDFGDGNTSTQQNPTHTYANPGQYTICLTVDNNGCSDVSCTTTSVVVGVEAAAIPGLQVAPNPYQGATQVRFFTTEAAHVRLEAFDVQGKWIGIVTDGMRNAGSQVIDFSAARWGAPAGVYLLRLTVGEHIATLRVQELR